MSMHNNLPALLAHVEMRIEKLRSDILEEKLYHHLDFASDAIVEFCAEAYSIYCEAKYDQETYTELLLQMRDEPGGKERPIKQFVYYIIAQRDLPYLMVQARNIIIAVLERADHFHQQWFPSLNMPEPESVIDKIVEHGGPTKIAQKWLSERSELTRKASHARMAEEKEKERLLLKAKAAELGKTTEEYTAELAAKASLDKLRDLILSLSRRIPEMIRLGLAVPVRENLCVRREKPALLCVANDRLYEINYAPDEDSGRSMPQISS